MVEEPVAARTEGPFGFLSRRRWLKLSLLGGTSLLMGGGGGLFLLRGCAPHVDGLRTLSDHEYRTLAALAAVHVPSGGPFPDGAERFDLARQFDAFLADEGPKNISDLKGALFLVEFGPVFFEGRLKTFSNLRPAEQLAHWQSWMTSRLLLRRQVATAFRKFLSFAFYTRPEVARHLGYTLPTVSG
jgi:hypothetical protein